MPRRIKPVTKSQYLVTVEGFGDVLFNEFSGINETRETSQFADGQTQRNHNLMGMKSVAPVTVGVPFDPEAHRAALDFYVALRDGNTDAVDTTIIVQPVSDSDAPQPRGAAFVCSGCEVTGCQVADVSRGSSDVSMLQLTFVYETWETR